MTTARFVVNLALQKLGVLGAGREARIADAADTLAALQGLYSSWIASGAFGRVHDVTPIGTTYTASGNERIIRTGTELEVVLPEYVAENRVNGLWQRAARLFRHHREGIHQRRSNHR